MKDPRDLAEPSAATVDFLVFAGLGFRWGLRCDVVARVTPVVAAFAHPGLAADEEFLLNPSGEEVPRALWVKTPQGERTLVTSQRPDMRRVERALLHKLPAMCAPAHPGSEEPVLRVTGLAARAHQVLFLVAEPVG